MSDTTPSGSSVVYGVFDGSRASSAPLSPADAGVSGHLIRSLPDGPTSSASVPVPAPTPSSLLLAATPPGDGNPKKNNRAVLIDAPKKNNGAVLLDADVLRALRESRMLSQEEMVHLFEVRNIRISIATIKRAETRHPVRYRIAREFARFFGVSFETLLMR